MTTDVTPATPLGDADQLGDAEVVARICARIDRARLTDHIVECIYREIPGYVRGAVPHEDLWDSVHGNVEMILLGVAEGRPPGPDEIRVRRELGRARASQGLPVDALVGAYHVGYRELWNALSAEVKDQPQQALRALLGTATNLWRWIHEITSAVTDTYAEAIRTRDLEALRVNQRFAQLLAVGDYESGELVQVARALGFAPEGLFQALVVDVDPVDAQGIDQVQSMLRTLPGVARLILGAHNIIVIWQDMTAEMVVDGLDIRRVPVRAGIGLPRKGFVGAHMTMGDAERAFAVASAEMQMVHFGEDWHRAVIHQSGDRLRALLQEGGAVARAHPHLAEAVIAYSASGFSVAEAARAISLHPNTVLYRLDRWHELTGWNPRTFRGLVSSLTSIEAADLDEVVG
jgi:hypothetical protein